MVGYSFCLTNKFGEPGAVVFAFKLESTGLKMLLKSVQSALSDLKRRPERLQSQCNYRPFIT